MERWLVSMRKRGRERRYVSASVTASLTTCCTLPWSELLFSQMQPLLPQHLINNMRTVYIFWVHSFAHAHIYSAEKLRIPARKRRKCCNLCNEPKAVKGVETAQSRKQKQFLIKQCSHSITKKISEDCIRAGRQFSIFGITSHNLKEICVNNSSQILFKDPLPKKKTPLNISNKQLKHVTF